MKFQCENCGCTRLEEVMKDVITSSEILEISSDGDFSYGTLLAEDGEVMGYQCMECGEGIAKTQEELIEILSK